MIFRSTDRLHIRNSGIVVPQMPVAALAASNWWEAGGATGCVAAYQPKGAVSLAASYSNLANPGTYDAAPGTAPTWDATNGWKFAAGSLQYLLTGVVPASGWSSLVQFTGVANTGYVYGCYSGTNTRHYIRPDTTGDQLRYGNGNVLLVTPRLLVGNLGVGGQQGYRNGTADGTAIGAWSGTGTAAVIIGGLLDGTPQLFITANVQAFAIYNNALDAGEMAAVAAEMAAL